jgi:hypothetical protein
LAGQCSDKFYQFTPSAQGELKPSMKQAAPGGQRIETKIMKKIITSAIVAAAACLLAGCQTTGLSPRETSGADYPNYILNLQPDGTNAPSKVVAPIHLAVAQVGEDAPADAMLAKLEARKDLITSVTALPLPSEGQASLYYNTYRHGAPPLDYAATVKALRSLAAASGDDYIFLFGGTVDSWQNRNPSALLDLTIVGGMIVPGAKVSIQGKGAGALINVATGKPVIFVSTESQGAKYSPDDLAEDTQVAMAADTRDRLIVKLSDELLDKLAVLNCLVNATNH